MESKECGRIMAIEIIENDTDELKELLKDRSNRKQLIETRRKITDNAKALKKLRRLK